MDAFVRFSDIIHCNIVDNLDGTGNTGFGRQGFKSKPRARESTWAGGGVRGYQRTYGKPNGHAQSRGRFMSYTY